MQIDNILELSEHCYMKWITTNDTSLPLGAVDWIRDGVGEQRLSGLITDIFSAVIKPSEKCYRFLKLTGVIEQERRIKLLRKQVLYEIDQEGTEKLSNIDKQWQAEINKQQERIFYKPSDDSLSIVLLVTIVGVVFGIVGALIKLSWYVGWLLVGVVAALLYRYARTSTLVDEYVKLTKGENEALKKGINENVNVRKSNIDVDLPQIEKAYNLSLGESLKCQESTNAISNHQLAQDETKRLNNNLIVKLGIIICLLIIIPWIFQSITRQNFSQSKNSRFPAQSPTQVPPMQRPSVESRPPEQKSPPISGYPSVGNYIQHTLPHGMSYQGLGCMNHCGANFTTTSVDMANGRVIVNFEISTTDKDRKSVV
jgi:preprotein translocase subunit Sss1